MLMRCKYGLMSLHVTPRLCTLKLPSVLMARRKEPVYRVVSPGSKVGFYISFDLRRNERSAISCQRSVRQGRNPSVKVARAYKATEPPCVSMRSALSAEEPHAYAWR